MRLNPSRRTTTIVWLLSNAILCVLISSCSDRALPTSLHSPTVAKKSFSLTDWYSCWKYEGDTSWRACEFTGTSGDDNGASWADFTDPFYYTTLRQVAVTQNTRDVEPEPPAELPGFREDTTSEGTIPNCSSIGLRSGDQAWCNGQDPASPYYPFRLKVIRNALTKMRALGPPCDVLADEMSEVLNSHRVRVYDTAHDPANTGFLYGRQASDGLKGAGYVLISSLYTDVFNDENTYAIMWTVVNGQQTRVKVDLQFMLAHEADHLNESNGSHLDPESGGGRGALTTNSVTCGGLGS
jgi:hypothetical protein